MFGRAWALSAVLALVFAQPAVAQLSLDHSFTFGADVTQVYVTSGYWTDDWREDIYFGPGGASLSTSSSGTSASASVTKNFSSTGGGISAAGNASSIFDIDGNFVVIAQATVWPANYHVIADEAVSIRVVESYYVYDDMKAGGIFNPSGSVSYTINAAAGDMLGFGFGGTPTLPGVGTSHGSFSGSTLFSVNDLPGETMGNPQPWKDEDYTIAKPDAITGVNLTGFAQFPVVDDTGGNSFDYGRDNYVYVGAASAPLVAATAELESEGAGGASYLFAVGEDSPNFSHFTIPDPLPGGDDTFLLEFEGFSEPYTAGTEFDFTALVPGGVSLFSLSGVDGVDPGQDLPGVQGFRFVDEGVAQAFIATVPVPEPSTLALALLGAAGLILSRRRRRVASFPVVTHDSVRRCPR